MRQLRKYRALAPAGRGLVAGHLVLLPVVALLLRVRGLARTIALLERRAAHGGGVPSVLAPREIARLVDAPAALLRIGCLPRSLVLWHSLRVRGIPSEIRRGVSKCAADGLAAHAWVEHEGRPLNDRPDVTERFAVLPAVFAGH